MKHLTKLAALMTAAAIFAFLPSAQVCGQSARRGGGGGGHSSSMSSSHGGGHSHSSSGSHSSGSTYSSGSSHRSGSVSSGHSRPSGSVGSGQTHSRPSGGSVSSGQTHSRPSGGSVSRSDSRQGRETVTRRPARSGGYSDGIYSGRLRSGASAPGGARPTHSDVRDHGAAVPQNHGGQARPAGRPQADGHHSNVGGARRPGGMTVHRDRPAPGSRPYADGAYGNHHQRALPSRIHVNSHPGGPAHRPHRPVELRDRPHHFHNYGHHYYGHYVPHIPHGYVVRHYWGRDYYYYDNIWYRYHAGRYWVCRPPWGYVFTPLADAVYTACAFAYYYDRIHYYDTINDNASTIVAQNETIAANNAVIASQNETIARNAALAQASGDLANSLGLVQSYADASVEYFYNDGVFYIKGSDGQYTVIVPPAGALVETLPDDYEVIELGGETYYKVDDTVYRTTIVEGKAMFEVLGQLTK